VSSKDIRNLLPGVAQHAAQTLAIAAAQGIKVTVTSVTRTRAEQSALRKAYEAALQDGTFGTPGGLQYPANKPGDSAHEYGFAFDSVTDDPAQMEDWVKLRKALGWRVPNYDRVHAELPRWREWLDDLRARHLLP